MRIIFVRHGQPDYARDCLTGLGRKQAAAVAERLTEEGIDRILSSTRGRAMETAQFTADRLGLPVEGCAFLREIHWGSAIPGQTIPLNGHPWDLADARVAQGLPLMDAAWAAAPDFADNRLVGSVTRREAVSDAWLASLGYEREELYYRVSPGITHGLTLAVFGHGGATSVILGRMFNLPFPLVCQAMGQDFTGITVVELPEKPGELVAPRFQLMNDTRHLRGLEAGNVFGQ